MPGTTVKNLMTDKVLTVSSATPTGKVLESMQRHHVSAMPVVDGEAAPVLLEAHDEGRAQRETGR